jgi:hypothetical protein
MKTPREILFQRHENAALKLDAIRDEVLNTEFRERRRATASKFRVADTATLPILLWRELIWPCRRIWTGLAAVWVLLFIVDFSQRDNVSSVTGKPARSGEVIMSLQARQRWMNELLADRSAPLEADRSRNFAPKPRSETSGTATV